MISGAIIAVETASDETARGGDSAHFQSEEP